MKLRFGKTMVDTNHIEIVVERFDSCSIRFISGEKLTIHCSDQPLDAVFDGTPAELTQYIQKADNIVSEEILKSATKS
ncbi:MAG: hypothetical protein OXD54_18820 [Candidatus Poribacteria bacterium]|nr:hypothetical protein [Candidatus Poribacteria bacterium]